MNLHDEPCYNSLFAQQQEYSSTTRQVATVTLDSYVEPRGIVPEVVKIDCEGAELEVVRGGSRLLARPDAPVVLIELNAETLAGTVRTVDELLTCLRDFGYQCFDVGTFQPGGLRFHNAVACKPAALDRMPALRAWCEQAPPASNWLEPVPLRA